MLPGRAAVIYDVARLARVSHQTVSRVLNHRPGVRADTRQRVLDAARTLNFRPNAMARRLAGGRSRRIGVIVPDPTLYGPTSTWIGVERAARAAGYDISIAILDRCDRAGTAAALGSLVDQSVAGVIVVAAHRTAAALLQLANGMPVVAVEASIDPNVPSPAVDQAAGARSAVQHLLGLGHRQIWHIAGPRDSLDAQRRVEGWRDALSESGLAAPEPLIGDWTARSGYLAGLELSSRSRRAVTAVLVASDRMAAGVLRAFHERGIRVPDDISVVGFDDAPEARYLCPPLTTVRQDFDEVGRRCVAALVWAIEADLPDGRVRPGWEPMVAPTLVVRDSTAACARIVPDGMLSATLR